MFSFDRIQKKGKKKTLCCINKLNNLLGFFFFFFGLCKGGALTMILCMR